MTIQWKETLPSSDNNVLFVSGSNLPLSVLKKDSIRPCVGDYQVSTRLPLNLLLDLGISDTRSEREGGF